MSLPFGYGCLSISLSRFKGNRAPYRILFKEVFACNSSSLEKRQLYLRKVNPQTLRPSKILIDFQKVLIPQGKISEVQFNFPSSAFAIYDAYSHSYKIEPGEYEIIAGGHCLDDALVLKVTYGTELPEGNYTESLDEYMTLAGLTKRMGSCQRFRKGNVPIP